MRGFVLRPALALGVLMAISACGGGGGGGGGGTGSNSFVLDYTEVTGSGAGADPYILPSENPDGVTQGIEDYLENSGFSFWHVFIDGQVQVTLEGDVEISGELIYEGGNDRWIININGENRNYRRSFAPDGTPYSWYTYTDVCVTTDGYHTCGGLQPWYFDDGKVGEDYGESKYGTFARLSFEDLENEAWAYIHFGLNTRDTGMPTGGTGSYLGFYRGIVYSGDPSDSWGIAMGGEAEVSANFGTGKVSFFSARDMPSWYNYTISGEATIAGSTYSGTMTASFDDYDGHSLTIDSSDGTLSGAFYGPAADETAGVLSGSNEDGEFAGGFWAKAQ